MPFTYYLIFELKSPDNVAVRSFIVIVLLESQTYSRYFLILFYNPSAIFAYFIYLFTPDILYLVISDFSPIYLRAAPMEFIVNANPPQANNSRNTPNSLSDGL